jgi:Zn-dependent metalloprotease
MTTRSRFGAASNCHGKTSRRWRREIASSISLVEHADELRLPGAEALREVHSAATPLGRVVRYQQVHDGLPILDTEVLVATDQQEDHVVQVDLNRHARLEVAPAGDQQLTAEEARESALQAIGNRLRPAGSRAPRERRSTRNG